MLFKLLLVASLAVAAPIPQSPSEPTALSSLDFAINAITAAIKRPTSTTQINTATWYRQNGIAGACGLLSLDTDLVVGLPLEYYDSMTGTVSPFCGTYISITNLDSSTNATVVARVADASQVKGALALSVATYRALDGDATDLRTVSWRFATHSETLSAELALEAPPAAPLTVIAAVQAPSPTSSSRSTPRPASSSPASSPAVESSQYTGGSATYYYQGGAFGSCGSKHSDSDLIVALPSGAYASGASCGRTVSLTVGSNSITAKVADLCPGCGANSIDLSVAAFQALGTLDQGRVGVRWGFV